MLFLLSSHLRVLIGTVIASIPPSADGVVLEVCVCGGEMKLNQQLLCIYESVLEERDKFVPAMWHT